MKNITNWRGAAIVLELGSPSHIYVPYNGTPFLCAPEQLRAALQEMISLGPLGFLDVR